MPADAGPDADAGTVSVIMQVSSPHDQNRRPRLLSQLLPSPRAWTNRPAPSPPQPLPDAVCPARFLVGLPDPHDRRGRRFPLVAIVTAAAAGVLAGARSLTAITEWITNAAAHPPRRRCP
ncbi:transposase family protein [Streptomyces sp. NPDC058424]|uniref:transposase family protein n=1 Tax=Streptomyces sp. NPDC058424 TaxID=3346491 RepID=UPI00364DB9E6